MMIVRRLKQNFVEIEVLNEIFDTCENNNINEIIFLRRRDLISNKIWVKIGTIIKVIHWDSIPAAVNMFHTNLLWMNITYKNM